MLADLARTRLVKKVELPDGEQVEMRVPVGTEAVDFLRDVRPVLDTATAHQALRTSFKLDTADEGALRTRLSELAPESMAALAEKQNDAKRARFDLAEKWLPKLVSDLADADREAVALAVRRTGGDTSPLLAALIELVGAAGGTDEDGLEAVPF